MKSKFILRLVDWSQNIRHSTIEFTKHKFDNSAIKLEVAMSFFQLVHKPLFKLHVSPRDICPNSIGEKQLEILLENYKSNTKNILLKKPTCVSNRQHLNIKLSKISPVAIMTKINRPGSRSKKKKKKLKTAFSYSFIDKQFLGCGSIL